MGDVCAGRTSMFQDLVRLLAIKKKSDQKNPVDRHDIFIIEEGHKMKGLTIIMVTQQFEQCIRHQNYDILLIL